MKIATVYVADDGRQFTDQADCEKYESAIEQVKVVAEKLKPLPKDWDCEFANGEGYIQQDPEVLEAVTHEIIDLFHVLHPDNLYAADVGTGEQYLRPLISLGRYCNDVNSPLYPFLARMYCIDTKAREWGQPYYATHPGVEKVVKF